MRSYKIDIGNKTYEANGGNIAIALKRAAGKFIIDRKAAGVRERIGDYYKIQVERLS
jgi:hypothetical protein